MCLCDGRLAPALSRESRRRAALRRPPEPVAPLAKDTVAVIRAACLTKKTTYGEDRLRRAAHGRARLRKHIVKLVVLVVMGFSPLPFLLTFV